MENKVICIKSGSIPGAYIKENSIYSIIHANNGIAIKINKNELILECYGDKLIPVEYRGQYFKNHILPEFEFFSIPYCADCKHHIHIQSSLVPIKDFCGKHLDIVSKKALPCNQARSCEDLCGLGAAYFEKKQTEKKQTADKNSWFSHFFSWFKRKKEIEKQIREQSK